MTKLSKRFIALFIAITMCFSLGFTGSAEEISPMGLTSSISGYEQATVSDTNPYILVYCTGSGYGGMGITIKNTCSANYRIGVSVYEGASGRRILDDVKAYTNGEVKYTDDLQHYGDFSLPFLVKFNDIPEGVSFNCQVWIYG